MVTMKNQTNTLMLTIFVALGAMLVVIPVVHEAQARSSTATSRDKGQQGDLASGGKRQGGSGGSGTGNGDGGR